MAGGASIDAGVRVCGRVHVDCVAVLLRAHTPSNQRMAVKPPPSVGHLVTPYRFKSSNSPLCQLPTKSVNCPLIGLCQLALVDLLVINLDLDPKSCKSATTSLWQHTPSLKPFGAGSSPTCCNASVGTTSSFW